MDSDHARSPTVYSPSTRARPPRLPYGPRSPKPPTKSVIPPDLCSRIDEATPAYTSRRSSAVWSSSTPGSPTTHNTSPDRGSSRGATVNKATQTSVGPPASPVVGAPSSLAVKPIKKNPTLSPPPPLNFDPEPVKWRGMTLEAAQWSLTSDQLQEIVSTAIRTSAQESFIRLLPLQTLNGDVAKELERLESLKMTTQAQYRFNMQRRMMLLQSLNALSFAQASDSNEGEALANLTGQLADITASCDRSMEVLLKVADQRAQLQQLQDVQISSALAMALRKLNTSYGKRTIELKEARLKISELHEELQEAWQTAEELAQEMDDLDNFDFGPEDEELGNTNPMIEETRIECSIQVPDVLESTGEAVATQAIHTSSPIKQEPVSDRASRVSAARRRSVRTSKASLRLPRSSSIHAEQSGMSPRRERSRSKSRRRPSVNKGTGAPQVPSIQVDTVSYKGGSFLELSETRPGSPMTSASPRALPPLPFHLQTKSQTQTLEVPSSSPDMGFPSPGFDRTIIPPLNSPGVKDDLWYSSRHERQAATRRVQSLQPRSRTYPLFDIHPSGLKRAHSDHWQVSRSHPDSWRTKARRYSVPIHTQREFVSSIGMTPEADAEGPTSISDHTEWKASP